VPEFLKHYIQQEPVEKLVIGLPVDLQNQPSSNQPLVLNMIGKIKKMLPHLPIETHDERFTSSLAKQIVLASGINKKARRQKENMDKISATLILQSYMEQMALRKA
jgi:putative Holliday junction resolvase